jgi:adenine-specific DNA methylase
MNNYPKRLIETDLPIRRISEHARREKSIRHGHISTLHIWWARRPLAACRAVLCAALWPDPADELCPNNFYNTARSLMIQWATYHLDLISDESAKRFVPISKDPSKLNDGLELRKALLNFIADFANWNNSTQEDYLETARKLTQAAHEALGGMRGTRPMVVDPFAGGGSIPLEALRVGADAFASDLNPVAVLLNKVVLEYIPKYGQKLADALREWGQWIKQEAEKELAEFYPSCKLPIDCYTPQPEKHKRKNSVQWELIEIEKEMPIAYLWARTIQCESPGCGAEIPLIRSLWLAKKSNRSVALRLIPKPEQKKVDFEIIAHPKVKEVGEGTVRRGSAICPCCGATTRVESVRKQLKARKGGANDARMFAVVCTLETRRKSAGKKNIDIFSEQGRFYRLPTNKDLKAVQKADDELEKRKRMHTGSLSLLPDEPTPDENSHRAVASVQLYGMDKWEDIFTKRQGLTLTALIKNIELPKKLDLATRVCSGIVIDRQANTLTSLSRWHTKGEKIEGIFSRQTLAMVWDYCEANPFSDSTGCFDGAIKWVTDVCQNESHFFLSSQHTGNIEKYSATAHPLPDSFIQCFFSDPPYYDSVPYSELSDFFYVWLKRILSDQYPDLFQEQLTPKKEQAIVWHPNSVEERKAYQHKMKQAMTEGCRIIAPDGIGVVVFAHKSTSGWESLLQAMIDSGWLITGSWPIDTEMGTRMNAMGTASLASSIHIVCRPRDKFQKENIGDWRDVLSELPKRIHEWLPRLAEEGIVGADAIFACLGPALEIYSRYSSVEKASGENVELKEYLENVWAAVSREALSMIFEGADASGFEEDARLTAMWLWTLKTSAQNGTQEQENGKAVRLSGYELEYDAARKIAQGLGIYLEKLGHLVQIKGNTATLLSAGSRAQYLFGKEADPPKNKKKKQPQRNLFEGFENESDEEIKDIITQTGKTVLDQLHQSMILFGAGRGEALKRFLVEEGIGRNPLFWRLAQALSALYPHGTEEKRWADGVLGRKKGLGL